MAAWYFGLKRLIVIVQKFISEIDPTSPQRAHNGHVMQDDAALVEWIDGATD